MKRGLLTGLAALLALAFISSTAAFADDIELARKSTVNDILERGELRVGFEAGYLPFEMADKQGNFIGFDIDMAKEMAKAMGVKFVPVNTAWDGIIPALVTKKFDIIMSGMTVTQERNLKINFADPYIIVGQTILLNKKWEGKVKVVQGSQRPQIHCHFQAGNHRRAGGQAPDPQGQVQVLRGGVRGGDGGADRQGRCDGLRPALLRDLHGPARRRQDDLPGRAVHLRTAGLGRPQG